MSNINRQADKADFLTSFKKVILMPVNAIPLPPMKPINLAFPVNPFMRHSAPVVPTINDIQPETTFENTLGPPSETTNDLSRSVSPIPGTPQNGGVAPTTELAAKAAILNSHMEGIRTLFNIELALDLVHKAKASLERAAYFVRFGGQTGEEA